MNKALLINEDSEYAKYQNVIAELLGLQNDMYTFNNENLDELLFTIEDFIKHNTQIIAII